MGETDKVITRTEMNSGYDTVWECVIPYIQDSRDRGAVSLTCRRWKEIDSLTRKHATMAFCYTATPSQLSRRFPQIESLKLKGKPRAAMFNLIPEDWGGYVKPWVEEIERSLPQVKAVHFRRMIVTDSDLELLARTRGNVLEVLKLDKCSGFSTTGLLQITRSCRNLKILLMEESTIVENDGEWLHELALHNTVLENLNFYMTYLSEIRFQDLELIARNCARLVSMKISDCEILDLKGFFRAAHGLEEFAGGSFSEAEPGGEMEVQLERYSGVSLSSKLCSLGFTFMGNTEIPIVFPVSSRLKKLDLLYAVLDTQGHCLLLEKCPNLEILETRNVIGNRGVEVVASTCKKLKRLRIERGEDEQEMEDVDGAVTQIGLIALAQGCVELVYLAAYVSDINNEALNCIGTYMKKLSDFRLVLLDREATITNLPLDEGVAGLLRGCTKLRRFGLYLRSGGLTDVGLGYIGRYGLNIKWMLLGYVGESDKGILELSKGCPKLEKLEIRGCCFSEGALALSVMQLHSLRYLWVQGYRASHYGWDLLAMARPFWMIELIPARRLVNLNNNGEPVIVEHPAHILAYYSLATQRTDFPDSVVPLLPSPIT